MEEIITIDAEEVIDQHIGDLEERWTEALPGSEESERIHKQLMETMKLKHDFLKLGNDSEEKLKTNRKEERKFWVQTMVSLIGVCVPTTLALAMLKFSNSGSYQTGDESKVFGWLFGLANRKI